MIYPESYTEIGYTAWHESTFPDDAPLRATLLAHRNHLQATARQDLRLLDKLLRYMCTYATQEYNQRSRAKVSYNIPLSDALTHLAADGYETLFKSVESTINKLWRLNKTRTADHINMSTLGVSLLDLVRTSIIASTLDSAAFLSDRLTGGLSFVHDTVLLSELTAGVSSIDFNPNMQMDKGYFAYHGVVKFRTGINVEVQIFSNMTIYWRTLNHRFYEAIRLRPKADYAFGQTETRLISLGHLLHLAECEITRIEGELPSTVSKAQAVR